MILKKLKYKINIGQDDEWFIEGYNSDKNQDSWVSLSQINLIVGRNASGKSKTINVIRQLSDLLEGKIKTSELVYSTGKYELMFEDHSKNIYYFLEYKDGIIEQEILTIDGNEKLNRKEKKLYYEEVGKNLSFQTSTDTLAVSRRDSEQQPFLENLYKWGQGISHYKFGSNLGRNSFLRDINKVNTDDLDLKDGDEVTSIFIRGCKLNKDFKQIVLQDMESIEYLLTNVDVMGIKRLPIGLGLSVKEKDLNIRTDQLEMSQGMFRALSLLIQINYSIISKVPSCILIDDIGEGLDYGRSKKLIELIIEKIKGTSVQIVMTTNDEFVMNKIPLEYWSIIRRDKGRAIFYNYQNSKEIFDEFEFTGLNNFTFFSSNYYQG